MRIDLSKRAVESILDAPGAVQKAFSKQLAFLENNLHHPSLRAKKFDESADLWQARVNGSWRFYFLIQDDAYVIQDVIPHPK